MSFDGAGSAAQSPTPTSTATTTASLHITASTFARDFITRRTRITNVALEPPAPEATITFNDDLSVDVTDLAARAYTVRVTIASEIPENDGAVLSHEVVLQDGEQGELNLFLSPPEPGGLPRAGDGASSGGARRRVTAALLAATSTVGVALTLAGLARSRTEP
jgi:hypothetical protein